MAYVYHEVFSAHRRRIRGSGALEPFAVPSFVQMRFSGDPDIRECPAADVIDLPCKTLLKPVNNPFELTAASDCNSVWTELTPIP